MSGITTSSPRLPMPVTVATEQRTLGERLRLAMRAKRMSNQQLAEVAGVHKGTVSYWLGNHFPPSDDNLEAIAVALETTAAWLKYGDNRTTVVSEPASTYGARDEIEFASPTATQRGRVWLEQFLLEIAEGGAPREFIESARRLLMNPDNYSHGFGAAAGQRSEMDDDQKLRHMQALAVGVRAALKERLKKGRAK